MANWSGVSKIIIACFIKQSNDLKSFRKYDFNIFLITDRLSQRRCAGYSFLESLAFLFKTQFIKNLKHMKVLRNADCRRTSAAMSSGLNGIRNKTEPPPMFEGDVYSADDPPGSA